MGKHLQKEYNKGGFLMTSCYSCVWGHHSILISKAKARVFQTQQNCYLGVITETVIARNTHTFSNKQTKILELKSLAQRPFLIKKLRRILIGRGKKSTFSNIVSKRITPNLQVWPHDQEELVHKKQTPCFVLFCLSIFVLLLFVFIFRVIFLMIHTQKER